MADTYQVYIWYLRCSLYLSDEVGTNETKLGHTVMELKKLLLSNFLTKFPGTGENHRAPVSDKIFPLVILNGDQIIKT